MMTEVTLTVPDELPELFHMSPEAFGRETVLLAAIKLFELGRLTSGQAASLAAMPRVEFLAILSRYGVAAINLDVEEAAREVEAARDISS